MSNTDVFSRFLFEMRALLSAIEARCAIALSGSATDDQRLTTLAEVARLSRAAATLAQTFEASDLRLLTETLATAADAAHARSEAAPFDLLGARDALSYLQWRVARLAAGQGEPSQAPDERLVERLRQTLLPLDQVSHAPDTTESAITDEGEMTLSEVALLQSFASANVRQRDAAADARLIEQMNEASARVARGEGVPVFGDESADAFVTEARPEYRRAFVVESQDDLRELGQLIVALERQPGDVRTLTKVAFIAHKIKGGAGTMGFWGLSHIARLLERLTSPKEGVANPNSHEFLPGVRRLLLLVEQSLVAADQFEEPPAEALQDAQRIYNGLTHTAGEPPIDQTPAAPSEPNADGRVTGGPASMDDASILRVQASKLDTLMNVLSALAANRGAVARNRDEIGRAQTETRATLARLREKSAQVADAHPLTYDNMLAQAQAAGPSHRLSAVSVPAPIGAQAAPTTPLAPTSAPGAPTPLTTTGALRASWSNLQLQQYTEVDTALRALAEVVDDVMADYTALAALLDQLSQLTQTQESLSRDIQNEAMSIRLARFGEFTGILALSAKAAADDLGKQINVTVEGESVEIDRLLLQQLEQPLIQLVRNAVAHGIESPDERIEQGKPASGNVWIHVSTVGAEVAIEVGDDGRGADESQLVDAAIHKELISTEDARSLSREQALNLMFELGITTLPSTTAGYVGAMAGGGVGLADVTDTIYRLKGSITMRSDAGKGTTFQIRAPISLSVAPVLDVTAAGQVFALPFAMVEYTAIVEAERLRAGAVPQPQASGGPREWRLTVDALAPVDGALSDAGENDPAPRQVEISAYALAELLGFEQDATALRRLVIMRVRGQSVGLLVEQVGEGDVREAAVRPLPQSLRRRVVRGVIVRPEDGQVALLIDPQDALAERLTHAWTTLRPATRMDRRPDDRPSALIVDDSVTIRRALEQMLTQAGFATRQARDGAEALRLMEQELPRVLVLDIEMPHMSGFDLLDIMSKSPKYEQVRIVMLTSRAGDEHRDYALAKGADAYLVKPCPQETLVETIRRLLTDSESE